MSILKNKKIGLFILSTFILALICLLGVSSVSDDTGVTLTQGNNNVSFNLTSSLHAADLVKLNPSIEVVSYDKNGKTFGYVNAFGGIGNNFEIENGIEYNVFVSENTTLITPET